MSYLSTTISMGDLTLICLIVILWIIRMIHDEA